MRGRRHPLVGGYSTCLSHVHHEAVRPLRGGAGRRPGPSGEGPYSWTPLQRDEQHRNAQRAFTIDVAGGSRRPSNTFTVGV